MMGLRAGAVELGKEGMQTISVVIPCYRSAPTIGEVVDLTRSELVSHGYDYEFILVNDCSPDDTFSVIEGICALDPKVVGLNLSKNFGQHNAIMAGLNAASGDFVLGMDDDLQTHPSQIHKLLARIEEGYDVVYAVYPERKHSLFRTLGSRFYQWTMRVLTSRASKVRTSSFWIARRFVYEAVAEYRSPHPHVSALVFRVTDNVGNVTVEHFDRVHGTSGYTLGKLIKLWSTSINFSIVPLRIVTSLGFALGLLGFLSTIIIVISKVIFPSSVSGWTSTIAVLLFMTGIIVFSIGMVGEYVGRLFIGESGFPQYVIKDEVSSDRDDGME